MQTTSIEWAGCTVNPIRAENLATGSIGHFCERVSEGCLHCYAAEWQKRFVSVGKGIGLDFAPRNRPKVRVFLEPRELAAVVRRRKPTDFFWCDMTDLFGEWVEREWLDLCLATMVLTCRRHTHKLLTKRPERARDYLLDPDLPMRLAELLEFRAYEGPWTEGRGLDEGLLDYFDRGPCDAPAWPPPNVLIGTSIENQKAAELRYAPMRALRDGGWFTWVSAEPLLELVDLTRWLLVSGAPACWVVAGGESGRKARRMPIAAPRLLRDQCTAAGVPFFFKQWGEWGYSEGNDLLDAPSCKFL